MKLRPGSPHRRSLPSRAIGAGALVAACALVGGLGAAVAGTSHQAVPAPPTSPTKADQIQNIDQVKTAIKGYYGDRLDPNTVDPVTGAKDLHTFDPQGNYAHEVDGIVRNAVKYLKPVRGNTKVKKAVLFDVDDTLLNTYNYEIYSNFVYNPTTNAQFVNAGVFPAVPGMVALERYALAEGYAVFGLTGRPEAQRDGTVANLSKVGYDGNPANLYLKDQSKPWLSSCAPTCTTIQYKSLTRKYIESQGYDIVANFGDQYSDLSGGYADRTYKLPNPMYYLP